jgi:hypothetical protein
MFFQFGSPLCHSWTVGIAEYRPRLNFSVYGLFFSKVLECSLWSRLLSSDASFQMQVTSQLAAYIKRNSLSLFVCPLFLKVFFSYSFPLWDTTLFSLRNLVIYSGYERKVACKYFMMFSLKKVLRQGSTKMLAFWL